MSAVVPGGCAVGKKRSPALAHVENIRYARKEIP